MAALRDEKLERFTHELLKQIVAGVRRSQAAVVAAKAAGYSGSSLASNARKRANRKDVIARMIELAEPATAEAKAKIEATLDWARDKLASIAALDRDEEVKPADQIAAIRTLAQINGWLAPERHNHDVGDTLGALLREIDGRSRGIPQGA